MNALEWKPAERFEGEANPVPGLSYLVLAMRGRFFPLVERDGCFFFLKFYSAGTTRDLAFEACERDWIDYHTPGGRE